MTQYKFWLETGYSGASHEETMTVEDMGYTEEEWQEFTFQDKEDILESIYVDLRSNWIDGGWTKVEED